MRRRGTFTRQEHHTDSVTGAKRDTGLTSQRTQESIRLTNQQAATITGQPIGSNTPTMRHARKCSDGNFKQRAGRLIIQLRNHAKATGIPLIAGIVQHTLFNPLAGAGNHGCLLRYGKSGNALLTALAVERSE